MNLDKFDTENQRELVSKVLLIGEGKADVSFLMKLMSRRGIPDLHFGFPTAATGGFGVSATGKYLSNMIARTGFRVLRSAVVFYDNDTNPAKAFTDLRDQVTDTDKYSLPIAPATLSDVDGDKVRLMFVPIPGVGLVGTLESLFLQSVANDAAFACMEAFYGCVPGVGAWSPSHQAKMRLRSLIAAKCEGDSDLTITNIWGADGNPIDLMNACFDGVVQAVRDVVAAV